MRHLMPALLLFVGSWSTSLCAADVVISDLRLTLGVTVTDGTEVDSSGSSVEAELDEGVRLGLNYTRSLGSLGTTGAFILGGGVFIFAQEGEYDSSTDMKVDVTAVELFAGYALALPALPIHVEAALVGTGGMANVTFQSGGNDSDDDGGYWDFGLKVGSHWAISESFLIGVELRYIFAGETTYHDDASSADLSFGEHFEAGIALGYRF